MRARREFVAFALVSTMVHALVLAGLPDALSGGETGNGAAPAEVSGADPDIAALVRAWDTPPETARPRDLSAPQPVDTADTSDAQAALEAVEAGEATEEIADTTDPGPTPDRPVMAALPTPDTTAPARLGMSMPAPSLSSPLADTGIDARVARSGGDGGSMAALSPALAAPSRPMAPPREESVAPPSEETIAPPREETMAPETSPLPMRRGEQASAARAESAAEGDSRQGPSRPSALAARPGGEGDSMAVLSPSPAASPHSTAPPPEESMAPESSPLPARRAESPAKPESRREVSRASAPAERRPGRARDLLRRRAAATSALAPGADGAAANPRARYASRIRAAIDAAKRYPAAARLRGEEGEVVLYLTIGRDGRLHRSGVGSGSGDAALDEAALSAARSVERFPTAPRTLAGAPFDFVIPVRFEMN